MNDDAIRLDGEDRTPIPDPQAVAMAFAAQGFDVVGKASGSAA